MGILKCGISQGRLINPPNKELQWFPGEKWREEFIIANSIFLNHIELLAEELHNVQNPIWSDSGRKDIEKYSKIYNLEMYSACFDYIIANSISNNNKINDRTLEYTKNFIQVCQKLKIKIIVFPLLGKSNLNLKTINLIENFLSIIIPFAHSKNIIISIESIAESKIINNLLSNFQKYAAGCVYDTGNRVTISRSQYEDIQNLSEFINHVHIKDKDSKNNNVVLGKGLVRFEEIFGALKNINYKGKFTMETNRGKNPVNTAKENIKLLEMYSKLVNYQ